MMTIDLHGVTKLKATAVVVFSLLLLGLDVAPCQQKSEPKKNRSRPSMSSSSALLAEMQQVSNNCGSLRQQSTKLGREVLCTAKDYPDVGSRTDGRLGLPTKYPQPCFWACSWFPR